jgi:phosphate transport system protein
MTAGRAMHSRQALDEGLVSLQSQLRALAGLVDVAIDRSILALERLDHDAARRVIAEDGRINDLRYKIEDDAVHLIAMQQPLASDLRLVVSVLSILPELERIGDYCAGIAKIVLLHEDRPLLKPLVDIPRMASVCREMLREAVDAFISRDDGRARAVAARDDVVDRLYDQVYRELLTFMLSDPRTIDRATWLIWVAHNLERIADRVQNVCERTVYERTGVMQELSRGGRSPRS